MQFEVTNIRLVEKFAKRGLAVGLVPARIARCFNGVVSVAVEDAPVRHVYAIWSTHPTPAAKAFVQLIEQRLAGRDSH
ncbi:LysR substrate binding domain protein [compost metagenome]